MSSIMCKKPIYLAGGMEFSGEDGVSWREDASKLVGLFGVPVWNPYVEESKLYGCSFDEIQGLDKLKDFRKLQESMRRIIDFDFNAVLNSSCVFVRFDKSVLDGAGTKAEMSLASYIGIPVYTWLSGIDIHSVPYWIIGCMGTVFNNMDEALIHILNKEFGYNV